MNRKAKKRIRIKVKNKKAFLLALKVARALLIVLIVAGAGVLSLRLIGKTAMSNVTDNLRGIKYYFSESMGYPYKLETLNSRFVDAMDNDIVILYNDHSQTLSSLATPMLSLQTDTANTRIKTCNGRALIVDSTSKTLTLQSKTEKLGSLTVENDILTASLGTNGSIAVATKSDGAQSNLTVYNTRLEPIFSWNCSSERITDIALSRSGKTVAVAAVGAKNANLYSRLIIFDVDSTEPVGETKFDGAFLLRVTYTSRGKVIAIGDNAVRVFDNSCAQLSEIKYTEDTLSHVVSDDKGNTVICVSEFGGSKTRVIRIGSNGKTSYDIKVDGEPCSVSIRGSRIALLFGMRADILDRKGKVLESVALGDFADKLMLIRGGFYAVESGEIKKY